MGAPKFDLPRIIGDWSKTMVGEGLLGTRENASKHHYRDLSTGKQFSKLNPFINGRDEKSAASLGRESGSNRRQAEPIGIGFHGRAASDHA